MKLDGLNVARKIVDRLAGNACGLGDLPHLLIRGHTNLFERNRQTHLKAEVLNLANLRGGNPFEDQLDDGTERNTAAVIGMVDTQ